MNGKVMTSKNTLKSLHNIVAEKCIKRRLPFERRSKLDRLQDILLESCARNLQEIFVEADHKNNMTLKKGVKIESDIFERILAKGKEIYLIMPAECVRFLLRFRDELNWQSIDLCPQSSSSVNLIEIDLKNISTSQVPVRKLTYYTCRNVTDNVLEYISSFSSNLEYLEIGKDLLSSLMAAPLSGRQRKVTNRQCPCKIKMPRLQHLVLRLEHVNQLEAIDHTSYFGSLKVLKLHDYFKDSDGSLNSNLLVDLLRNCKNLVSLCFKNVQFGKNEVDDIFEAISSLKNLRTLEMQRVMKPSCYDSTRFDISRIISSLPKLENVELSYSDFVCSNINFRGLRLKYLGALQVHNESILRIPTEVLLGNENLNDFDVLLCSFERDSLFGYPLVIKFFTGIALVGSVKNVNRLDRLENAFLKIMVLGRSTNLNAVVGIASGPTFRCHLSLDFWAKLIRFYVSYKMYFKI